MNLAFSCSLPKGKTKIAHPPDYHILLDTILSTVDSRRFEILLLQQIDGERWQALHGGVVIGVAAIDVLDDLLEVANAAR